MSGIMMPMIAGAGGGVVNGSLSIGDLRTYPVSANSSAQFNADGSTTMVGNRSSGANWYSPITPGIGASFWVKFTLLSGAAWSGPASGTLTKLDSTGGTPKIAYTISSPGSITVKTASIRIDFYSDAGGVNLVSSWSGSVDTESS